MSTEYFGFRKPITSVRPEVLGGHTHVGVWVNHAKAGTLVFRNEEWKEAIWLFVDAGEGRTLLHTFYGGKGKGKVVVANVPELQPERLVVGDLGEIVTVAEVWAGAGAGA